LRHGEPPPDAARWAPYTGILNLVAGGVAAGVIVLVVAAAIPYSVWSAIAGSTIWCKLIFDYALSRHAHKPLGKGAAR
jgi:hypothetical protein